MRGHALLLGKGFNGIYKTCLYLLLHGFLSRFHLNEKLQAKYHHLLECTFS